MEAKLLVVLTLSLSLSTVYNDTKGLSKLFPKYQY